MADDSMTKVPQTPDFDFYPVTETIRSAKTDGHVLTLQWSDGLTSRYHAIWLRMNACDPETFNPDTREITRSPLDLPAQVSITQVSVRSDGAIGLRFLPEDHDARFDPGWLRLHDYSNGGRRDDAAVEKVLWTTTECAEPPTFDGADIMKDDAMFTAFLTAVASHGLARLRGAPADPDFAERFASRIGVIRDSNFGRIWNVRVEPGAGSNAYTALELAPHVDLATREYQPGLQILHCVENTTQGGRAMMIDGFRVAEDLRLEAPEAFRLLTTVPWHMSNRAADSDYRWNSPAIVLDQAGQIAEIRSIYFLRGPLNVPFDLVEDLYAADRLLHAKLLDPRYRMLFGYLPGDLMLFDNRRILHGREAFDAAEGRRWLRGCYLEREELESALRMAARRARARAAAGT
ncbi:MAG: TauD/TfdA family dioxygenase [Minwuia sp.]|nr:TauD/TfdA family dioxygenase [Minwuia sp.]